MRLAASIAAVLMLSACGGGGDEGGSAPAPAEQPQRTEAEKQAILASLPAPYNTADIKAGQGKFGMCRSCHTITPGGSDMTGPNLHGLIGRKAATHGDYKYSEALKAANLTWDAPTLDRWIEDPRTTVPGTKMAFAGMKDPKARIDLIGYLATEAGPAQ